MWTAKEIPVSEFADPQGFRLPRFQRKSTWNAEKDFYLALSFFRGLPLGTVVIKSGLSGVDKPYLLDGRQRWEALQGIGNPDLVYEWAVKAMGIRAKWSDEKVISEFRRVVETYFGSDPGNEDGETFDETADPVILEDGDDTTEGMEPPLTETMLGAGGEEPLDGALPDMLAMILCAHPKKTSGSGFTKPFAFFDIVKGSDFVETDAASGSSQISSKKLRDWIAFKCRIAEASKKLLPPSKEDFRDWIAAGATLSADQERALENRILVNWGGIEQAINLIRSIDARLRESHIAALYLTGTSASEDAKIFDTINTGGTELTAAEVLSANPHWNTPVDTPYPDLVKDAANLYRSMGLETDAVVVRWDVPATILSRLKMPGVLGGLSGPLTEGDIRGFERRVTLGFQLVAGWYRRRIEKDTIESLPQEKTDIPWGTDELPRLFNSAISCAFDQDQFKYWNLWKLSIIGLMSDAIALDFILATTVDWVRLERPKSDGAKLKLFKRNARVLLDRLIFEYCSGTWRGSSDSRIRIHLDGLVAPSANEQYEAVAESDWEALVREVMGGSIKGVQYTDRIDPRIRLLLGYRNVIRRLWPEGVGAEDRFEVDHIIPSSFFLAGPTEDIRKLRHHIGNLALLIGDTNREKSDKKLSEIASEYSRNLLVRYEDVPEADFGKYSAVTAAPDLLTLRLPLIEADLTTQRAKRLNES